MSLLDEIPPRYELKYLITEDLVPSIRQTIRNTCKIDRYAGPDGTYRIRSLYFDTARYELFMANEHEQRDRFKVRARAYPGKTSPVFLEVKRRVLDVIIKSRVAVPADKWLDVLAGKSEVIDQLPKGGREKAHVFLSRYFRHHLEPVLLVEYEREAYESQYDAYARATFDRNILAQEQRTLSLEADPHRWRPIDHRAQTRTNQIVTVLELKFERRPPAWMSSLVRGYELSRYSFSKYCYGLQAELTLPSVERFPVFG
ncbi:MAG: polyphosphate polymerase domain-containing protein [Polyangiaceae bacterium]|nr:polyphosphate polymerase domain-containing protein [Polyangiaceae bacterium]